MSAVAFSVYSVLIPKMRTRSQMLAVTRAASTSPPRSKRARTEVLNTASPDADISSHVAAFRSALESLRDPERAEGMKMYVKGQFEFFGVPAPARRKATKDEVARVKELSAADPLRSVRTCTALWAADERELQYVGVDLMDACRKHWKSPDRTPFGELARFLEKVIAEKQWWDSIDMLASHTAGDALEMYPSEMRETLERWVVHDDVWFRRSAILAQLSFKENMDADMLFRFIRLRMGDEEFWIRKAIGWALRSHRRTDVDAVDKFVEENLDGLSKLSVREAWKHKN